MTSRDVLKIDGWHVYVWIGYGVAPGTAYVSYVGCSRSRRRPFRGKGVDEVWVRSFRTYWMAQAAERLFIDILRPLLNRTYNQRLTIQRLNKLSRGSK